MAFAEHIRLSMIGTFGPAGGGGMRAEAFSYGVNLSSPSGNSTPLASDSVFQDMVDDAIAFHGRPGSWIASQAVLQVVKVAKIGPDGRYLEGPKEAFVNQAGGGGALRYPFQVAMAVSLVTDRRGATGRGRFYLPAPTMPIGAETGVVAAGPQGEVNDSVKTFLEALANVPGVDPLLSCVPVVASSKGYNTKVTGVRTGNVLDTIRTRRRQLLETYSATVAISTGVTP